jgi:Flp pilus assembly protein TadG
MTPAPANLARDQRGATLVGFALVAPVLALMLVGALDVAHSL